MKTTFTLKTLAAVALFAAFFALPKAGKAQLSCPYPITNYTGCDAVISYTLYYLDANNKCVVCTSASGVVLSCCAPGGSNSTINVPCSCGNLCSITIAITSLPGVLSPPTMATYPRSATVTQGPCTGKVLNVGLTGATIQ